jgi:hypothetical protein
MPRFQDSFIWGLWHDFFMYTEFKGKWKKVS